MKATTKSRQRGSALLVSMIMLVAITLLVVFSIRSGNTNLRIAGNAQAQFEATQATQHAVEQVIVQINEVDDLSLIKAQALPVKTGPATYNVSVKAMNTCLVEVGINNDELKPTNANDLACFASQDVDSALTADGKLTTKPSECKLQQWEIEADIGATADAGISGAKVVVVQGVTVRVPSTVTCL